MREEREVKKMENNNKRRGNMDVVKVIMEYIDYSSYISEMNKIGYIGGNLRVIDRLNREEIINRLKGVIDIKRFKKNCDKIRMEIKKEKKGRGNWF